MNVKQSLGVMFVRCDDGGRKTGITGEAESVLFVARFQAKRTDRLELGITAHCRYKLYLNGRCRLWSSEDQWTLHFFGHARRFLLPEGWGESAAGAGGELSGG